MSPAGYVMRKVLASRQGCHAPSDECQSDEGPNRVWRRFWLQLLVALCAVLAVLFIAALFVPVLDVNKRQRVNEAGKVSRLRRLNELQDNYAASNPATRLPLPQLKPATSVGDTYSPEFLLTGAQSGYKFAVTGCRTDPNGVTTQYQVTAVPLELGKSGFRAFCTDQTGVTGYDSDGSAERCLASRRPLQYVSSSITPLAGDGVGAAAESLPTSRCRSL
jgi:hypothetical protein